MKIAYIFLIITLLSCNNQISKTPDIQVIIKNANTSKVDLGNKTMEVFYMDKPSVKIPFKLSNEEIESIKQKYYELKIDRLGDSKKQALVIDDNCDIDPKLYVTLEIKSSDFFQTIQIDRGCKDYSYSDTDKAIKINLFLNYIDTILKSKQEIINAPKSNVYYY